MSARRAHVHPVYVSQLRGALTFLSGILTFPVRRRQYGEVP